ncbi:nascent polypeptide-associated complex protein [Candidatus Woesearchaeota archaeon]|nr:nascent polypeptide-associated complex protein [Candidatus Woesearchaeota archaeon]
MFPGMNPRKMQQMMRQMGVQQEEINAQEVIIRTPDKDIIVVNPSVIKVNMMGQETLQITGQIKERPRIEKTEEISLEDIETVQEQTGATAQAARQALEEANGDLAEAILALKKED